MNATPRRAHRGWSWPRTLAVATLAIFGAFVGMVAVPFLVTVLVAASPGWIGTLSGWWLGLGAGAWLGLRVTR